AGARQRADALLQVEERLALLLHDHAAEDLAEQADVSAERCFAVGAHRRILRYPLSTAPTCGADRRWSLWWAGCPPGAFFVDREEAVWRQMEFRSASGSSVPP